MSDFSFTFRGTVYYPSGGTWYRDVEISSAPGLATRGASLFASANGKGFARAIPISRHFSMFSTTAAGQIKFSQFPREIEPTLARTQVHVRCTTPRRSPRNGRSAVNELPSTTRSSVARDPAMKRALRLIKL